MLIAYISLHLKHVRIAISSIIWNLAFVPAEERLLGFESSGIGLLNCGLGISDHSGVLTCSIARLFLLERTGARSCDDLHLLSLWNTVCGVV